MGKARAQLVTGDSLACVADHRFLASGVWSLVGEAGLEASAGFVVGGASVCLLVGGAGSWSSGGQGHV